MHARKARETGEFTVTPNVCNSRVSPDSQSHLTNSHGSYSAIFSARTAAPFTRAARQITRLLLALSIMSIVFFVRLSFAAGGVGATAVPAIAIQDGVARSATARRATAHASRRRAGTSRFAAVAAIASAAAATVMNGTISDTPGNIARSVL